MNSTESIEYRNELIWKIKAIDSKLGTCAKIQEGKNSTEDPNQLFHELDNILDEYSRLLKEMKKLKTISIYKESNSLSDVLAEREVINAEKEVLQNFLKALKVDYSMYETQDIKYVCTIEPSVIESRIEKLENRYNELEDEFKKCKWDVIFAK